MVLVYVFVGIALWLVGYVVALKVAFKMEKRDEFYTLPEGISVMMLIIWPLILLIIASAFIIPKMDRALRKWLS
jgi:hypothetical protein